MNHGMGLLWLRTLGVFVVLCGHATVALGQRPVREQDGSYRWVFTGNDGEEREIVLKSHKPDPVITTTIDKTKEGEFVYTYSFENRRTASAEIHLCMFEPARPVTVQNTPSEWRHIGPLGPAGRVSWLRLEPPHGVLPGESVKGFTLRSTALPGPALVSCRGMTPPESIPEDTPAAVLEQYYALRRSNEPNVAALVPIIATTGDSHIPLSLIVSRIVRVYRTPDSKTEPASASLTTRLDTARAHAERGAWGEVAAVMRSIIAELESVATQDWNKGLRICTDYVLTKALEQR